MSDEPSHAKDTMTQSTAGPPEHADNVRNVQVLPVLQGDVDFLTGALSWYAGGPAGEDVKRAWERITGALSDHAAFRDERNAVALHVVAKQASRLAREAQDKARDGSSPQNTAPPTQDRDHP